MSPSYFISPHCFAYFGLARQKLPKWHCWNLHTDNQICSPRNQRGLSIFSKSDTLCKHDVRHNGQLNAPIGFNKECIPLRWRLIKLNILKIYTLLRYSQTDFMSIYIQLACSWIHIYIHTVTYAYRPPAWILTEHFSVIPASGSRGRSSLLFLLRRLFFSERKRDTDRPNLTQSGTLNLLHPEDRHRCSPWPIFIC